MIGWVCCYMIGVLLPLVLVSDELESSTEVDREGEGVLLPLVLVSDELESSTEVDREGEGVLLPLVLVSDELESSTEVDREEEGGGRSRGNSLQRCQSSLLLLYIPTHSK